MKEDDVTVKKIRDGLDTLEQYTASPPPLEWLEQTIALEQKRIRKKQWQDLFTFIIVAALVLAMIVAVVYRQPMLAIYMQLLGVVLLPLAIRTTRKRGIQE